MTAAREEAARVACLTEYVVEAAETQVAVMDRFQKLVQDSLEVAEAERERLTDRAEVMTRRFQALDDSLTPHASAAAAATMRGDTAVAAPWLRALNRAQGFREQGKALIRRALAARRVVQDLEIVGEAADTTMQKARSFAELTTARWQAAAYADSAANVAESEADSTAFQNRSLVHHENYRAMADARPELAELYTTTYAGLYSDTTVACPDSLAAESRTPMAPIISDTIQSLIDQYEVADGS